MLREACEGEKFGIQKKRSFVIEDSTRCELERKSSSNIKEASERRRRGFSEHGT